MYLVKINWLNGDVHTMQETADNLTDAKRILEDKIEQLYDKDDICPKYSITENKRTGDYQAQCKISGGSRKSRKSRKSKKSKKSKKSRKYKKE